MLKVQGNDAQHVRQLLSATTSGASNRVLKKFNVHKTAWHMWYATILWGIIQIVDVLYELYWLLVCSRVTYKIALTCYKADHLGQSPYLEMMLYQYVQSRLMCSSANWFLTVSASKTKKADRQFSCAASELWNTFPRTIRNTETISTFKLHLKTHLFVKYCD